MLTRCDNCYKKISKIPCHIKDNKHNFCSRNCYFEFKKKYHEEFKQVHKKDYSAQRKIKNMAKKYANQSITD